MPALVATAAPTAAKLKMGVDMPKGPKGEKRPADAIGLAVMIGKIATREVEDKTPDDGKDPAAKAMGAKGGKARAAKLTPDQRSEIAKRAAAKRWEKKPLE